MRRVTYAVGIVVGKVSVGSVVGKGKDSVSVLLELSIDL